VRHNAILLSALVHHRYISGRKEERLAASLILKGPSIIPQGTEHMHTHTNAHTHTHTRKHAYMNTHMHTFIHIFDMHAITHVRNCRHKQEFVPFASRFSDFNATTSISSCLLLVILFTTFCIPTIFCSYL
jgi:hypothetical protein